MYPACLGWLPHLQAYLARALVTQPGEISITGLPQGNSGTDKPQTRWEDDFREEGTGQGA